MNLQELKEMARFDFKDWLDSNYNSSEIIGTEPDDWMESIQDFASRVAGLAEPSVILENEEINSIDLGDGYSENTLITGLIFDRVYQFLDRYLYDEFDDIVEEITDYFDSKLKSGQR